MLIDFMEILTELKKNEKKKIFDFISANGHFAWLSCI